MNPDIKLKATIEIRELEDGRLKISLEDRGKRSALTIQPSEGEKNGLVFMPYCARAIIAHALHKRGFLNEEEWHKTMNIIVDKKGRLVDATEIKLPEEGAEPKKDPVLAAASEADLAVIAQTLAKEASSEQEA